MQWKKNKSAKRKREQEKKEAMSRVEKVWNYREDVWMRQSIRFKEETFDCFFMAENDLFGYNFRS